MSEQLAIKTDDDWIKGSAKVFRTLTPRESDYGKRSSWAHYSSDDDILASEGIPDAAQVPRLIHALAMFFWSELNRAIDAAPRNAIKGVSIPREAIGETLIEADSQPHLIPDYSTLHRSLLLGDSEVRMKLAKEMADSRSYETWKYTRADMANVLRFLLERKAVAKDMEAAARSVLAQWDA